MQVKTSSVTRAFLACGAISGPLFILVILVQAAINPGFDLRTDLISLLSIGRYGYLQIANFALCGVLNIMFAVGVWRLLHRGPSGTFAPIFIALHGILLVVVAVFVTNAVALAVFVRYFLARRELWWAAYSGASTVLMLAIFFASFTVKNVAPVLDVSLTIGWMGISVIALKLLARQGATQIAKQTAVIPA